MKTTFLTPNFEAKIKRSFSFSLRIQCLSIVLLLLGTNKSFAYDFEVDGLYYNILDSINNTVEVTYHSKTNEGYKSGDSIIKIPQAITYNNIIYSVSQIGNSAFYNCKNIISISIPNSVEYVSGSAFYGCTSIKEVIIEDGINTISFDYYTINSYVYPSFHDSPIETLYLGRDISIWSNNSPFNNKDKLTSLTIGNYVTTLTSNSFNDCDGLTEVFIPNSITNIQNSAFRNCRGLTKINISNSVETIGDRAFKGCNGLTEIILPNSVTSIGREAFYGCTNLQSIIIGSAVGSIDEYILSNCINLKSIVIDSSNNVYDSRDNCNAIIETSTNKLIVGCQSTIIPYSIKSIGEDAFSNCEGLTSITIPEPVALIEGWAFNGCSNLTTVIIGDSVKLIQDLAFAYCENLEYLYLGKSVKEIKPNAFYNCNKLTKIDYNAENLQIYPQLDYLIFDKCPSLTEVNIGKDVQIIPPMAFYKCTSLTNLTFSNGLTKIGSGAFYGCNNLTQLLIPKSVTNIGNKVFYDCNRLYSINVDEGNTIYDSRNNCNALINTASNSLILGGNCTTIPNSVISIEDYAFLNCKDLAEIIIPKSVTNIGKDAFFGCNGLYSIIIESENTVYDSRENCNAIIHTASNSLILGCNKTIIPNTVTSVQDYAFMNCEDINEITIPNSVTNIGESAFENCTNLSKVNISNSILIIPAYIFKNCTNLIELDIPESVTTIEYAAFQNCDNLVTLTLPSSIKDVDIEFILNCSNLSTIYCKSEIPPNSRGGQGEIWDKYQYEEKTLYVPIGSKSAYENKKPWRYCKIIEEMEFSNIEPTFADNDISVAVENGYILINNINNTPISIFNTIGQCIYNGYATSIPISTKGLHIVKVNNKSFKVIL